MSLAAIFAENIGIDQSAIILALILVQFVAFPSTLFWSYIGNKFNDKTVLYSTIFIYICVVIYSTALSNATEFYIMAALIGSVQGGIQAASRSFFSKNQFAKSSYTLFFSQICLYLSYFFLTLLYLRRSSTRSKGIPKSVYVCLSSLSIINSLAVLFQDILTQGTLEVIDFMEASSVS